MTKTILLTGATDGIGLETAKLLVAEGHKVLLHGRSAAKLDSAANTVGGDVETYQADLSDLAQVKTLAADIKAKHSQIDILINNAGVLKAPKPVLANGQDLRFVVNTYAPYLLTELLLPLIPAEGRVVNLSSAAQAPVNLAALKGGMRMGDMDAYAQSKLAIAMWSQFEADAHPNGPSFYAVNPGSLLASKMVHEGFGVAGSDLGIGADILKRAALSDEFAGKSGQYFDNDAGRFAPAHPDAASTEKTAAVVAAIKEIVSELA